MCYMPNVMDDEGRMEYKQKRVRGIVMEATKVNLF